MASSNEPPAAPGPVSRPAPLSVRLTPASNETWLRDYAAAHGTNPSAVISGLVAGLRQLTERNEGIPAHHEQND